MRRIGITGLHADPFIHTGHINLLRDGKSIVEHLIVILSNDNQCLSKHGYCAISEKDRKEILLSNKYVDEVIISSDIDSSQIKTLSLLREKYPNDILIYLKGGDRSDFSNLNQKELEICAKHNIMVCVGVGGYSKEASISDITEKVYNGISKRQNCSSSNTCDS